MSGGTDRPVGRIEVVLEHASVGGGTLVAADLLAGWAATGVRVGTLVLGTAHDAMRTALGAHGALEVLGLDGHVRRALALRRLGRDLGPDDVLFAVGDYCGLVVAASTLLRRRSRRPRIVIGEHQPRPLVTAARAARGPLVASVVAALESVLRRRTAGSVLTEAGQGRTASAWRRSGRPGTAIPNPSRMQPSDRATVAARVDRLRAAGPVRLIVVGALNPQKDHATLVAAMRSLDPRFTLSVVGRGEIDVSGLAALSPGVEDRVDVLGARDDVAALLDAHDVLVLASRWETAYPLVVVEAVVRGLPVVATECSPVMRTFADGLPSVRLVPVADPAGLASAIAAVAADPPDVPELLAASAALSARHDLARSAAAHLAFFAGLRHP